MSKLDLLGKIRPALLPIAVVILLAWIGGRFFFLGAEAGREALPFFFGMGLLLAASVLALIVMYLRFRRPPK